MHVEPILIFVLAAVAVVAVVRWVAGRTGLPAAALLPLIGIGYALLPGPNIPLDPDIVLAVVLPPLLYSAALDSSMIAIRRNLRTVVSLSVVLVLLTALLIGLGFAWFVTGATLAAGIAVGAAVAPPDPVAALAVGRKVGLPPRIITLIQGEGLLNDATALTILSVAVAAATGDGFSAPAAVGQFLLAAAGGVAVGALVAFAVRLLSRPLSGDPMLANAVSLAIPFGAYLLGEVIHVSGVLAVVVAGLIVGHHTPRSASGAGRLQTNAVWRLVDFLLEGFIFLLIGQQLPEVIRGLAGYDAATVVVAVAITVGVTLLLRPLWLVLTLLVPRALHTRWSRGGADARASVRWWTGREVVVLSWAGTRGVISLAAIFTLPLVTETGDRFPARDLLLFCTVVVVLVTLVGQGLTFAPMVRALGLRADDNDQALLRNEARAASVKAALTALDELEEQEHEDISGQVIETMREQLRARLSRYRDRLSLLRDNDSAGPPISPEYEAALHVRRVAIDAQREECLRWRDAGRLSDEGLRVLERELDLEERLLPDRPARR
ncbi:CPA1 family monovalent cation:H+ antiporter [Actinoplanes campanulatus]|uniref:CPA1 family monovalent cation:H+ antiporter n=1 Tax=Actinoplanes campanulatus TaxID=113559 RepID=A0A7W5AHS2_9ACTN|nr:Na+/H+ antiporter [Actinoplanes campanulatus]MBB3096320.1 CPA1 family monovalent cation:H+ antiporter [Actinoplanes campanulatus]GGN19093.1 putative Na+/H+ antiporter [Actinoplanes campanulatus]GID41588.1 putative Na+/H+ antiporter [Actinoplanes campanulatus]